MDKKRSQSIHCSVGSCEFNDRGDNECRLKAIQVSPQSDVVDSQEESMCHSFKRKDS